MSAGRPAATAARSRRSRGGILAAALVFGALVPFSSYHLPNSPDGLNVLRTSLALAFESTWTLPAVPPGVATAPLLYFFRPSPDGNGLVVFYQPVGPLLRAVLLRGALLVPPGPVRGRLADIGLCLLPALISALTVLVVIRLARFGGLPRVRAQTFGAALVLTTFLAPLGLCDYNEPLQMLVSALALERALWSRRVTRPGAALVLAGALAGLANLVKPVGIVLLPALVAAAALPGRRAGGESAGRRIWLLAAGGFPMAAIFLWTNHVRFGRALEFGYFDQPLATVVSPLWSILRLTVFPNRGLFVLAPLALLILPGLLTMRRPGFRRADRLVSLLAFGGFFTLNLAFWAWESGMGWSPRYLAPALAVSSAVLAAGARGRPRLVNALCLIGILVNLPGLLLDPGRLYVAAAATMPPPAALGPVVRVHEISPGRLHPLQYLHYVPRLAPTFVGWRALLRPLGPAAAGDSLLVKLALGAPIGPPSTGRILLEEAAQNPTWNPSRAYRTVLLARDFGGSPTESLALASYLALVLDRPAEARGLAEEGLRLAPERDDLRRNLAAAMARTRARPSPPR